MAFVLLTTFVSAFARSCTSTVVYGEPFIAKFVDVESRRTTHAFVCMFLCPSSHVLSDVPVPHLRLSFQGTSSSCSCIRTVLVYVVQYTAIASANNFLTVEAGSFFRSCTFFTYLPFPFFPSLSTLVLSFRLPIHFPLLRTLLSPPCKSSFSSINRTLPFPQFLTHFLPDPG